LNNTWRTVKLGEVCSFNKTIMDPLPNCEYRYYSFPAFDNDKHAEIVSGDEIKSSKFLIESGDILYNKLNVKFKRVWNIDFEVDNNSICSTEFIPIQASKIDRDFLYYFLISPTFTNAMVSVSTGSSNSHQRVDIDYIKNYEMLIPSDLEIQKRIADILKTIDNKIEICKSIIVNLEKQAQEIFKFTQTNNSDNIIKLGDICSFKKGKKPTATSNIKEEGFLYYLTIDVLSGQDKVYAHPKNIVEVNEFDLLMVMDGASSGRLFYGKSGALGSTLSKIEIKKEYEELIFQFLKYYEPYISRYTVGSDVPHTNKDLIFNFKVNIPNNLEEISQILYKIRENIINNKKQIEDLINLKEMMLPKLIYGEIDI